GLGAARARALRRDSQGRAVGGRDDGRGDGVGAVAAPRARRHRDDRRDHAVGPGAPGGRHQGEGARRETARPQGGDPPEAEREERERGSERRTASRADDSPREHDRRGAAPVAAPGVAVGFIEAAVAAGAPRVAAMIVVYSPRYDIDIGAHVFPTRKYPRLYERIRASAAAHTTFVEPSPASWSELARVHTPEYLEKTRTGD